MAHLLVFGHGDVDDLSRRNIDNELEAESLMLIKPMEVRTNASREISGCSIAFFNFDVSGKYVRFVNLLMQ